MNNKLVEFKISGLAAYLFKRIKLRFFYSLKSKTEFIYGNQVNLDLVDLEQKYLAADCVREPENLIVYKAIAKAGMVNTFVDVGANCGHVAASILNDYSRVLLFEPNPKLAHLLRAIFVNQQQIAIKECAIVDAESVGSLTLTVPDDSSGLATLGSTDLSKLHTEVHTYNVKASTLEVETKGYDMSAAYIKIDVEGFEGNIIDSARSLIENTRPIVGFEALTNEAALQCAHKFNNYVFYCARFDFLEKGGALSRSVFGMIKALLFGANIVVLKLHNLEASDLNNFSQVYSVPMEKSEEFEEALASYAKESGDINLSMLRTWSN